MRSTRVIVAVLLAMCGGCAVRPDWPDPESAANAAAGIDGAIVLEVHGEPIDVDPHGEDRLTMVIAVREALREHDGAILFAHADLSGFSVFEEAAWWGDRAARLAAG